MVQLDSSRIISLSVFFHTYKYNCSFPCFCMQNTLSLTSLLLTNTVLVRLLVPTLVLSLNIAMSAAQACCTLPALSRHAIAMCLRVVCAVHSRCRPYNCACYLHCRWAHCLRCLRALLVRTAHTTRLAYAVQTESHVQSPITLHVSCINYSAIVSVIAWAITTTHMFTCYCASIPNDTNFALHKPITGSNGARPNAHCCHPHTSWSRVWHRPYCKVAHTTLLSRGKKSQITIQIFINFIIVSFHAFLILKKTYCCSTNKRNSTTTSSPSIISGVSKSNPNTNPREYPKQ